MFNQMKKTLAIRYTSLATWTHSRLYAPRKTTLPANKIRQKKQIELHNAVEPKSPYEQSCTCTLCYHCWWIYFSSSIVKTMYEIEVVSKYKTIIHSFFILSLSYFARGTSWNIYEASTKLLKHAFIYRKYS